MGLAAVVRRVNECDEAVLVLVGADRDDEVVRGTDDAVAEGHRRGVDGERIVAIYAVRNPDKLAGIRQDLQSPEESSPAEDRRPEIS